MRYSELILRIMNSAPFATEPDAEQALLATLQAFGNVLPQRVLKPLQEALPQECTEALTSRAQSASQTASASGPGGGIQSFALERMQEVCGGLRLLLSPELVDALARELPAELAQAFEEPPTYEAPPRRDPHATTLAEGRPGATHPLSESAPGSQHPLSSSRRGTPQQGSVAASNPHADTKLSSARGFTQERERETLAEGHPPREKGRL